MEQILYQKPDKHLLLGCVGGSHDITTVESLQFNFVTIEASTNKFSANNKLREGGFGEVYKLLIYNGYMSPEYAMHGQFSMKLDVYSLGVLVLEIITSKKNSSFYQTDGVRDLLSYEDPADRPTMATLVLMLNSYSFTLPLPQRPAFFLGSRTELSMQMIKGTDDSEKSTTTSMPWSVDDASITEVYPR
ncbi:hypothetical protein Dsin_027811 [Dipteronia sinensis]|uniref:Serine-threonine/tyrosine-protein kinase catalytic domain-containing protein n=1 Tax=Dipteronia sinensis TaxID=43782 RepID=A0AAD9ZPD4_9ROSI|nr:hypothetical protein Dsin_027811 [Dipteronia sinensis]